MKRAIELCDSISLEWHRSMIARLSVESEFDNPGYNAVFPLRWHRNRADRTRMDQYLDFQVSVEHTVDGGSNLLFHSNNDVDWIMNALDDLRLSSDAAPLREDEIYTDLSDLKV
ncbi:MAG: hypothetical protein AAFX06_32940 [Planctomycetota bacterium]